MKYFYLTQQVSTFISEQECVPEHVARKTLGERLTDAIIQVMDRLDATDVVINNYVLDMDADVALFEGDDCIEMHYVVDAIR